MIDRGHPCKGCEDRNAKCHADCVKYRLFTAWRARRKKKEDAERSAESQIILRHFEMKTKADKRNNR